MLSGALVGLGVVAWRGIITKILTAPYEDRDGWELNVMYVNGTMYFEEHATQEKLNEKNDMKPRQLLQTYYGYAFESYCTSETPSRQNILLTPDVPYGWNGDVNTNVQWCSVVRTKLGDTRIVIGGEVDCVRDSYTGKTDKFVELKTSMTIRNQNDEARFEKKLLKFYFQSFLLGVPEVVVGFRTPAGVVTTTQSFKTIQIPRMVRGKADAWDPLICLDWGHRFLTFLKETVEMGRQDRDMDREDSSRVWRVKFTPGSGISVRILGKTDVDEVVNGEDRVGFLPSWYWEEPRAFRESPGLARPTEVGGRGPQPPSAAGGTTNSSNSGTTSTAGWQI
ncbi:RAI1 like PD-XK nuclease-domain-containing protein [Cyathus striatus]|nr:RAI1 like PD-XK nuclease-domain-containing protein [Cyathus striatus]